MERSMRLRTFALSSALALGVLATACTGADEGDSTPAATAAVETTPAPTATPLGRVPDPILVTGAGLPGSNGSGSSEEAVEYVVESGDTIGGIAERFGVDAELIRQANDLEDDFIDVGQTLIIPRGGTLPPPADDDDTTGTPSTPPTGGGSTYTVQPGDTAFGIALEFDTTVEALAAANGMTEDEITNLQIGQVINLPSPQ
ncbi:MAG: LysM peptidoglycan-binding domain-containing protein [Dehalococcoidia bacterium]